MQHFACLVEIGHGIRQINIMDLTNLNIPLLFLILMTKFAIGDGEMDGGGEWRMFAIVNVVMMLPVEMPRSNCCNRTVEVFSFVVFILMEVVVIVGGTYRKFFV